MTQQLATQPLTYTHNGVEITYDEVANLWRFTLRNRDRSTASLTDAKEAIDKRPPEKAKPFDKIEAWWVNYNNPPQRVQITGIAEGSYSRHKLWVWIKSNKGRSKEQVEGSIYQSDATNDAICEEIIEKEKEINSLRAKIQNLRSSLQPLKLEIPE